MIYADNKTQNNINIINYLIYCNNSFIDWDIENYALMQSTGLKDKNGTLIYEGDIIKVFHVSSTGQARSFKDFIYFNKEYPSFQFKTNGFIQKDDLIEIIGNIYENKDLLERTN